MIVNNSYRHSLCPLCSSHELLIRGNIEYVTPCLFSTESIMLENKPELWACKSCGSGFTQNVIPEKMASVLYQGGKAGDRWSAERFEEAKDGRVIRALGIYFQKKRKILDIGCNTGELLDFAKQKGCQTFGVELSESSREILMEKGHETFPSLDSINDSYDVITAFDLVEHLYDFSGFISRCYDKLNARGVLAILTGNISSVSARISGSNWWYIKYPEHILFPSEKYMKSLGLFNKIQVVPAYASVGYRHALLRMCKGFVMAYVKGTYQGLPSLGPDHMLVVLQK